MSFGVHTLFVHTYQFIGQKGFFWILWFQPKVKLCLFSNSSSIHSKNLQKTSDPNYQHKLGKIRAINKSVNAVINVSPFFKFFMIFFSHGVLHSTDWRFYYVFAFSTFYEYPTFLIITFFCFTFYIRLLFSKKFFSDHDFVMKKPQKFKCKFTCT